MTDWFRSWHGAPTDPKWLGIARRAGVAPGMAVAVAWALMDRASQASDRGDITGYDADGLACFFGCDPEQVEAIVAAMSTKGMLADGRFVAWERRQPKREDDSTDRVRAHRERNKTQPKRDVTHRNAPDTEADTDTEDRPSDDKRETPAGTLAEVLDAEHAKAVVDHRQRIRKPLTPHAAKLLAGKFAQCPDPNAAADTMIANGWQGFEPSWLTNRSTGPPAQRSVNGFAAVALALAEQDHDPGTHADFDPPGGGTAPRSETERGNPQPRVLDTERPERAGGAYTVVDRR